MDKQVFRRIDNSDLHNNQALIHALKQIAIQTNSTAYSELVDLPKDKEAALYKYVLVTPKGEITYTTMPPQKEG